MDTADGYHEPERPERPERPDTRPDGSVNGSVNGSADGPADWLLAGLEAEIEGLLAVDAAGLDDEGLHETMVGLVRLGSRLDAAVASVASVWEARGAWATDRSKSARARLARDTRANPKRCGAVLHRARKLRSMPRTQAAHRAGKIGTDRVDVLAHANAPHRAEAFRDGEAHLVAMATTIRSFDDFARLVRYWEDAADGATPDGDPEERARRQRDARHLDAARTLDGVLDLRGRLDPVDGEIVNGELTRIEHNLFKADWAQAREQFGPNATADRLARTPAQRRADALVIMARRSAACPDDATPTRPLISVLCDLPTLTGAVRELFNGTVLTAGQIARLLTEADIERIVYDGPSRIIDIGVRARFFSGATRRAIEVRDRRCTHPGCNVPAEWCHLDHITEWANGGLTTQDNGRLLCPTHNRQRPGRTDTTPTSTDPDPVRNRSATGTGSPDPPRVT